MQTWSCRQLPPSLPLADCPVVLSQRRSWGRTSVLLSNSTAKSPGWPSAIEALRPATQWRWLLSQKQISGEIQLNLKYSTETNLIDRNFIIECSVLLRFAMLFLIKTFFDIFPTTDATKNKTMIYYVVHNFIHTVEKSGTV